MMQTITELLPRGYVAAYRILGNAEDSQDACQEAAARALAARRSYDASRPFYPWFYRILRNHCFDLLRRRSKQRGPPQVDPVEPREGAPAQLAERERDRLLTQAIDRLPEDLRQVIELRHFQELSYQELAELLECPQGTVMSRLYRARKALRQALRAHPDFDFGQRPGGR